MAGHEEQTMLEEADRLTVQECSASCNIYLHYQLSRSIAKKCEAVKHLIDSSSFHILIVDRKSPIKAVKAHPSLIKRDYRT